METLFSIVLVAWLLNGIAMVFAWLWVIVVVNPILDKDFLNDRYFSRFLREAHPFFFAYRAYLYSSSVVSKRSAKRVMRIVDYDFKAKLALSERIACYTLFIGSFSVFVLAAVLWIILKYYPPR